MAGPAGWEGGGPPEYPKHDGDDEFMFGILCIVIVIGIIIYCSFFK